ncbi:tyrosinase-like protein 1 isoform X2 [Mizuhopecten yessoensis]|uniref:tyrosinase-like protein 1 isoform X2 n=1 Tax=Mizuhopecten yessoensis TaxID=6573 RepID=UPI000B458ACF|nr:tyrosinase-like protein 1 isoform X2 [Mizuhopecten yessoensis]
MEKICVLFLVMVPFVTAIEELPYPETLHNCFVRQTNKSDSNVAGELISTYCINQYLWVSGRPSWQAPRDSVAYQVIQKLFTQGANELSRRKRATEPLRVRKEYRMLSRDERKRFHDAITKLKERIPDTRTSVYDTLADIHQGRVILQSVHGGANFLGWHRVYIYLLEQALRVVDDTVTLPYWDCTLDYEMEDPTESIIFSYRFAGNGDGKVLNGVFRNWGLVRNVGLKGNLMSKWAMDEILSRRRTHRITEPDAQNRHNIEFRHNGIHSWVGGHVGLMNMATRDPLFFLIHCFIDYVWWRFQQQQIKRDIDPSSDYPINYGSHQHRPSAKMTGFPDYRNRDGYSNHWTRDIYTYQLSPECPQCGHSSWLKCVRGVCVSKARNTRRERNSRQTTSFSQSGNVRKLDNAVHHNITHQNEDPPIVTMKKRAGDIYHGISPVQNTFEIDGKASVDQWVFMPVKVINVKSGDLIYNSYPINNGHPMWNDDIYTASNSEVVSSFLPQHSAATYENCKRSTSGALKIYVRIDGRNYDGHSVEHALTDERLPFSSSYAYVAIKSPLHKPVELMATAHDECGRMCRPMCRFKGNNDFIPCTGHMHIKHKDNGMYASTVADAMLTVWRFENGENIFPKSSDKLVYLSFLCDSKSLFQ